MNERFTTLDQVVKDICEIGGDDYDHKSYGKVLKVCVNTLRGFNLYSSTPYVKTEEFEVLPNNTVLLPRNALDVVRVGKNDRCGEIEEIFYSKDLSMDAKNIEEHCECSGKVQVIETIETGTGETLCDYIVEGIDLGSGDNIEYETIIIFAETFEMQNGWVGDGIQNCCVLQNITSGVITNIVEIKALELNNASSVSSGIYTISGSQIATMVYDKLSILALPNYTIVLDNNILTITTNNDWLYFGLTNMSLSSYSKYPTGEFYFTWTTNGDIESDIFVDDYKYFLILPFKEPLYSFEVNINGEWEDETDNVSENGTWSLSNTTNIVTEWRYVGFNEGGYAIDYDMSVPVYDFGYMNLYGSDYIKGLTNINTTTADGILITVKVVEDGVESEDSIVLSGDQTFLNIINAINGLIDSSWFITGTVNVGTQNLKIENKAGREGNVIIQIDTNNPSAQFTPSQYVMDDVYDNFGSSWRRKAFGTTFGSNVNVIEWAFVQYPLVQIELDSVWTTIDMVSNHWEAPLDIGEVTAARTVLEYIFVDFEYERIEEINTIPFTITPPSEEPGEPTPIEGICRVDLQRQEVSKWVDNNIECDNKGRCKSCGNFVPTYTTAWYGGWYSSAPIYSRQLAQNNLNLPNSGQAYYEQYTARPYPARWGFYNLDLAKGVLRLSYNFEHGEKIVIIYSTDMVEVEGAKVVAVEWFDMLLYRCKELIWNRNSVDGTRQRQLYEREYTRIKKIYNKTTHEEWRRAIMKVKYSGVKR